MATTFDVFNGGTAYIPGSVTELFEAEEVSVITAINATNTSAANSDFTLYVTSNLSVADATNAMVWQVRLAPGESYQCPELQGHVIQVGQKIWGVAATGSAITLRISGLIVTE